MRGLTLVFLAALVGRGVPASGQTPSPAAAAVEAAQTSALAWLALVDRGRYRESWDSAATFYRRSVTSSAAEKAIRKARSAFEPLGARTLVSASYMTKLPASPPGEYVVLQYRVGSGSGKSLLETVTPMRDVDTGWRVSGYYIRLE